MTAAQDQLLVRELHQALDACRQVLAAEGYAAATEDALLLDVLARHVAGQPAACCDWRDLLRVRERVVLLLDREVNRRQAGDRIAGP